MYEFRKDNDLYCGDSIIIPKTEKEIESPNIKHDLAFGCMNPVLAGMSGSCSSVKPNEIASMTVFDRKKARDGDYIVTCAQSLCLPYDIIDRVME